MKTIIAGSRDIWSYALVERAVYLSSFDITEVFCGMAPGADSAGWAWAHVNGIPIREFPADWDDISRGFKIKRWGNYAQKYNPRAGLERNTRMAKYADALIAVTRGSSGTANMIMQARDHGLKVFVLTKGLDF